MRYYKTIDDGYITAIGTGGGGTEITESEYNEIMTVIQNKPPRTETTDYHLKTDLTWEAYTRTDKMGAIAKATENIQSEKYFTVDETLYYSTASIAVGEDIIPGENCIETTIADELNSIKEED